MGSGIVADLGVVTAGVPAIDGCPVLQRLAAFVVAQGSAPVLEHVFRDRQGRPLDLSAYLGTGESVSSPLASGGVRVRVKEWIATGASVTTNPIWDLAGYGYTPAQGVLRAPLLAEVTEHPGIYELAWGITDGAGNLLAANDAILSVERSLFPTDIASVTQAGGPITLQELRLAILDSSSAENTLLGDVEFSDAQVLQAIAEPVRYWNEAPPPLRQQFTTRTFPFRGNWLRATAGWLHLAAANHYRRNYLAAQAGGISVPDKAKEQEYLAEGQRLVSEYKAWVEVTKLRLNMKAAIGSFASPYGVRPWY